METDCAHVNSTSDELPSSVVVVVEAADQRIQLHAGRMVVFRLLGEVLDGLGSKVVVPWKDVVNPQRLQGRDHSEELRKEHRSMLR